MQLLMKHLFSSIKIICLLILTFLLPLRMVGNIAARNIFVIAVRDSSLFTLCAPSLWERLARGEATTGTETLFFGRYYMRLLPDGRLALAPLGGSDPVNPGYSISILPPPFFNPVENTLDRARPNWHDLARMTTGISPSGWLDPQIKQEIETALAKHKEYALVDSSEKADLVFLAEGLYYVYWPSAESPRISNSTDSSRAAFGKQVRSAVFGVVVPSEIYRQHPADAEKLLAERMWAGVALAQYPPFSPGIGGRADAMRNLGLRSASAKEVAEGFIKKKKWPADVPRAYPAWAMRTNPAAFSPASTRPIMRTSGSPQEARPQEQSDVLNKMHAIRINTTLVSVPVIASDDNGRYVSGLSLNDLHVYEDGVEQKIDSISSEAAPVQAALLMDLSSSTRFDRSDIEAAALELVEGLRSNDALMALSFRNGVFVDAEFTADKTLLRRAIKEAGVRADKPFWPNNTRLYDSVDLTITERLTGVPGRNAILLFSDGIDIGSRLASAASTLARIEESNVLVYVIRYDAQFPKPGDRYALEGFALARKNGSEYLQNIAANSGGRLFDATAAPALREAFSVISEELRNQYTLYYYPRNPSNDGQFRRISVTVEKSGIKLRFRKGYRVP